MKLKLGQWTLWVLFLLLLAAAAFQVMSRPPEAARMHLARAGKLSDLLPANLGVGTTKDEPIAATDEMKKAVGELLNYDDAVFRIYQMSGYRISVYAAWWAPGKMSPRLVAGHTPDVCWPEAGWERDRKDEAIEGASSLPRSFLEGERRVFRLHGKPEYVVFWHKVGGELRSYGNGYAPPWWAFLDEMRRDGLNLRKEQFFVRVSSDVSLDSIWLNPELEPLRSCIAGLGLK
jgi:hypothetical protein